MIALTVGGVFAGPMGSHHDTMRDPVTAQELLEAYPQFDGVRVSDVTVNDLLAVAEDVSVTRQEERYVAGAAFASLMVPGAGQFVTGRTGQGVVHLVADVAIAGGALYGAWALLPEELQSALDEPSTWETYVDTNGFGDLKRSAGVLAAGFALDSINALISASSAARTAMDQVASGEVRFEPDLAIIGRDLGLMMRFRY